MAAEDNFLGIPNNCGINQRNHGYERTCFANDIFECLLTDSSSTRFSLSARSLWLLRNTRESLSIRRLKDTYTGFWIIEPICKAMLNEPSQHILAILQRTLLPQTFLQTLQDRTPPLKNSLYLPVLIVLFVLQQIQKQILDVAKLLCP